MNNSEKQLEFKDERKDVEKHLEKINQSRHPVCLLLDGLDDVRNIGSIFRLADAALIEKIYLYNCNFDSKNNKLNRVARSTIQYVPFEEIKSLEEIIALKNEAQLVSLEVTNNSIPYTDFRPEKKVILVIGNESRGVSPELLNLSDISIHLPMYGVNTSMNVMVATGIATYSILEKINS